MSGTWTLVEPTLAHLRGHHVPYALGLASAAAADGGAVRVLSSASLEDKARDVLARHGIATVGSVDLSRPMQLRAPVINRFAAGLVWGRAARAMTRTAGAGDHVVTIAGDARMLGGICAALLPDGPRVPFDLLLYAWERDLDRSPIASAKNRAMQALLSRAVARSRVRLFGQTEQIARRIVQATDCPAFVAPMLVDWAGVEPPVATRLRGERAVLGFVGEGRDDKGFGQFVALACAVQHEVDIRALVTRPRGVSDEDFAHKLEPLRRIPGAVVLTEALSPERYLPFVASLDLVALLYDPAIYGCRTSGVLVEALGVGAVPVVTRGTWLSDHARTRQSAAIVGDGWSSDEIVAAVRRELPRWRELRDANVSGSARCRAENSAAAFYRAFCEPVAVG